MDFLYGNIFSSVALLVVGFFLLTKGADWFVSGASALAKRFNVPEIVIGLTIVAFGTSAPELAVSVTAALEKNNAIALGNCIGSNIFNLLIVGGLSAAIMPMAVSREVMKKDYLFAIACALVTFLAGSDGSLSRADGCILLLFFAVYLYSLISNTLDKRSVDSEEKVDGLMSAGKMILFLAIGLVCVVFGGDVVVNSASSVARFCGVSDHIIGLTIVAMGTSLPELVTSVVAARKGSSEIAIGNIIGSNIFNIVMILGLSSLVTPIPVERFSQYDLLVLIGISVLFFFPLRIQKKVSRPVGVAMLVVYAVYVTYIFVR